MRVVNAFVSMIALVSLAAQPAYAQRGNSGSHAPSAHGPSSTHGPSTPHGPSTTTHSNVSPAHGPSGTTHGPSTKSPAGAHPANAKTKTSTTTGSTSGASSSSTSGSGTGTNAVDFTATSVGQKLSKNTALSSKLLSRLQAEGYTGSVYQAAYGFKNLGQFVAATNVSQNLGIPFDQLKQQMTGVSVSSSGTVTKSTTATKSLGQAIQTLKSGVDATAAANTATSEADGEIASSSTTGGTATGSAIAPTTSTSSSTVTKGKRPARSAASQ